MTNVPESLKSRFDVVVESALLGERKPEPRIYDEVLKQLNLKGEETVFLDDIGSNLKAANKHGIKTIKVKGGQPQNALHELQALLKQQLVSWPKAEIDRAATYCRLVFRTTGCFQSTVIFPISAKRELRPFAMEWTLIVRN